MKYDVVALINHKAREARRKFFGGAGASLASVVSISMVHLCNMKCTILAISLFSCVLQAAEPPAYSIIADINFSPYAGGEDLLFATKLLERGEDWWFQKRPSKSAQARIMRLSELVTVWLPLNYMAMLIQHEVFGHGYRIRDLGTSRAKVVGYQFDWPPPYGEGGAATSYMLTKRFTCMEESAVSSAGIEATAILANEAKWIWLTNKILDARQSMLYLLSQHDIAFYISSIKIVRSHAEEDFTGHDIDAYLRFLNLTYPDKHLSSSRLRSLAWIGLLDPFSVYAIWSWFHYLASGRNTKMPMIPTWSAGYLFSARLGLTPFGPEYFVENYFSGKKGGAYYFYLKAGRHAYNNYFGVGMFAPVIWRVGRWDLGMRFDAWRQPKLLLQPGSIPFSDIPAKGSLSEPLYSYSERHQMKNGFALSALASWRWNEICGFEGELGGKMRGFLPGYSLFGSPTVRGGFYARF